MKKNLSIGFCSSIYVCHVCLSLVFNEGHISSIKLFFNFTLVLLFYLSTSITMLLSCYSAFCKLFCLFFFIIFVIYSLSFGLLFSILKTPKQIPFRLPLRCYFISRVNVVERLFITFMPLNMIFFVFYQ